MRRRHTSAYQPNRNFIEDVGSFSDWAIYLASRARFDQLKSIANDLEYSTRSRRFQALSGLCAVDTLELPSSPKVLLIGYREDTYDAQGLAQLGMNPSVEYLDLAPAMEDQIIKRESFESFSIAKKDANDIGILYEPGSFDLVYFSRASLDTFYWEDTLRVLDAAREIASIGVIAHLQSIFWINLNESGSNPRDDWLVLDLMRDRCIGEQLGEKTRKYLLNYAATSSAKRIGEMATASLSGDDLINNIAMAISPVEGRITSLDNINGSPVLCSVQLDSSPLSPKKSLYMSSVVMWRTS
ncbi:MAG: hypothetical protein V3T49_05345 [Dehalococcoidia bacterium]